MNTCVVIPAYNSQGKVYDVIEDVLKHENLPVWIIDDGSEPKIDRETIFRIVEKYNFQPSQETFSDVSSSEPTPQSQENQRVQVKRFEENQGKGAALKWALKKLSHHYTHIITIDADRQHLAKDIAPLMQASREEPEAIIIGARRFGANVPGLSKFGRKFSNFWVWYQTSKKISDSQSGFRIYPLKELSKFSFFTKRYDFEIEVLVRHLWKGFPVKEVAIDVHYPKSEERVSHFDKIKDNARITGLNILLISYSLIFYQKGLLKLFIAALLGLSLSLLSGWTAPLFLTILSCVLLKLNFPLVLIVMVILKIY